MTSQLKARHVFTTEKSVQKNLKETDQTRPKETDQTQQ